jgi:hypothetical protein
MEGCMPCVYTFSILLNERILLLNKCIKLFNMNIRKAQRKQAKIKLALQGPSGSGKTYSSLLLAKGLIGDFSKVCIIDTENGSADLYAHLGPYNTIAIQDPYTPEKYIQALELAETQNMEVIILDSISHSWQYLIDFHAGLAGNSFSNWAKVTPRHNALFAKILSTNAHIITTLRVKQDYVLNDKNGKLVPEKVGLKAVQRDGVDYEFTLVFDLNVNHLAHCSKDRTGLFLDQSEFIISETTGLQIKDWCNEGILSRIQSAIDIEQLGQIYRETKDPELLGHFIERKKIISNLKINENGNH